MKLKNFIIAVLCIGALICLVLYVRQKLNLTYFGSVKKSETLLYDEVYSNSFDKISIENDGYADIIIKESDDENISLKIYADSNNIEYNPNDSQLNIKTKSKTCVIFCDVETSVIELYLPKDYDKPINIDSDVGTIEVGYLDNLILDAKLDTGTINIGSAKDLKIDADAVVIYINTVNEKLELDNDTGNISIDNLKITENSYIETDVSNINILQTSEIKVEIKNGSRLSHINNNYQDSNVVLTISNDIGEININN